MAFTYDLSTDRGQLRLRLADTNSEAYAFEDAELDHFLTVGGSVDGAARLGVNTLRMDRARRARKFTVPGMSYDDSAALAALHQLAKDLGATMPTVGVVFPALQPFDSGFVTPS